MVERRQQTDTINRDPRFFLKKCFLKKIRLEVWIYILQKSLGVGQRREEEEDVMNLSFCGLDV
jgi:hypothetical protein